MNRRLPLPRTIKGADGKIILPAAKKDVYNLQVERTKNTGMYVYYFCLMAFGFLIAYSSWLKNLTTIPLAPPLEKRVRKNYGGR